MPRRELKSGRQIADWFAEIESQLKAPGNMTLIGSAALLWHAHDRGLNAEPPEDSMDIDPEMTNIPQLSSPASRQSCVAKHLST